MVIDDKHSLSNFLFKKIRSKSKNDKDEDYLESLTAEREFGFDEINKLIKDENENFNYLRTITEDEIYF